MEIARIEVYRHELPYRHGRYLLSGGRSFRGFDATLVRMLTACGLEGWGESTPFGATFIASHAEGVRAALARLAPAVIGLDPRRLDRLNDTMDEALKGHLCAKAPLDIAAHDILGKAAGLPVCDLLGGRVPLPVPVISSVPVGPPDVVRAHVASLRAQGFRAHSLKIGPLAADDPPQLDAERILAATSDRVPGEWFLLDANGGLSSEYALRLLALLPDGQDLVLEAPCATWRETLSLRRRCPLPILLDELIVSEADLLRLIAEDAADGIGLKVSKQGGLTRSRRMRDLCVASGLVVSVQETVGSQIALAALLHLAQSTNRLSLRYALDTRAMVEAEIATIEAPLIDGCLEAPFAPGLGITVDREKLGEPLAVFDESA